MRRMRARKTRGKEKEALDENYTFISFHNYGLNKHGNRKITSANMALLQLKRFWS